MAAGQPGNDDDGAQILLIATAQILLLVHTHTFQGS